MSYEEIEQSVVWLYKFILYSIATLGLFMVGIFAIALFT